LEEEVEVEEGFEEDFVDDDEFEDEEFEDEEDEDEDEDEDEEDWDWDEEDEDEDEDDEDSSAGGAEPVAKKRKTEHVPSAEPALADGEDLDDATLDADPRCVDAAEARVVAVELLGTDFNSVAALKGQLTYY
jgi:hypothetical protein